MSPSPPVLYKRWLWGYRCRNHLSYEIAKCPYQCTEKNGVKIVQDRNVDLALSKHRVQEAWRTPPTIGIEMLKANSVSQSTVNYQDAQLCSVRNLLCSWIECCCWFLRKSPTKVKILDASEQSLLDRTTLISQSIFLSSQLYCKAL